MKFFLDENVPLSILDLMRVLGFEAEHARNTNLRGAADAEIADYAKKQKVILITKDLEFGSLLLYPKGSHYGLIIIRLPHYFTTTQITRSLKELLSKPLKFVNAITILERGRYRVRKL